MTEPFAIQEVLLNPSNGAGLPLYQDLARQTHWHVIIPDHRGGVLRIEEFRNVFGLQQALAEGQRLALKRPMRDFPAAQRELEQTCSLHELLRGQY